MCSLSVCQGIFMNKLPKHKCRLGSSKYQSGMTLLEVAVAVAIMAIIYVLSNQAISVASDAYQTSEKHGQRLESIDRAWFLIKEDLKYVLNEQVVKPQQEPLPPLSLEFQRDQLINVLRANNPNPTGLMRTDIMRIAYRLDEDVLVRMSWNDPAETDEEYMREQKILDGIEELRFEVLPPTARSIDNWTDRWKELEQLPLAVRVTMNLKDRGEMIRIFALN